MRRGRLADGYVQDFLDVFTPASQLALQNVLNAVDTDHIWNELASRLTGWHDAFVLDRVVDLMRDRLGGLREHLREKQLRGVAVTDAEAYRFFHGCYRLSYSECALEYYLCLGRLPSVPDGKPNRVTHGFEEMKERDKLILDALVEVVDRPHVTSFTKLRYEASAYLEDKYPRMNGFSGSSIGRMITERFWPEYTKTEWVGQTAQLFDILRELNESRPRSEEDLAREIAQSVQTRRD